MRGFTKDNIWGHRVADRAVDFLENVSDEKFVLAVSFDEPHGPFVAPPEYWAKWTEEDIPRPENYMAPLNGKPDLQKFFRKNSAEREWLEYAARKTRHYACNSYIDTEIGRVIAAVDRLHQDDTMIIYTSDHGNMCGAHGQHGKGPMMYEDITNIPFIVRVPDGKKGAVSQVLTSHLDILPTMLDYAGQEIPPV